jgi:hypothetical protein
MAERTEKSASKRTTGSRGRDRAATSATTTTSRTVRGETARTAETRAGEQQIRERAYYIFLARNGGPGDPVADWQQAERELTGERR